MKTMNEQAQNEETTLETSCCPPEENAICCDLEAKADCCGVTAEKDTAAPPTKCGCR